LTVSSMRNIAIFVNTPSQAHLYKNIVSCLEEHGNQVMLLARDYGGTLNIVKKMQSKYTIFARQPRLKHGWPIMLPIHTLKAIKALKEFQTDIVVGFGIYAALTAKMIGKPCVLFNDTEPGINNRFYAIQFSIFMPLIDAIITPKFFQKNLGKKQIRIDTFKELAYLHPKYFEANDNIYDILNIDRNQKFVILRFNAFDAVHDIGLNGFSPQDKVEMVKKIREEKNMKIFISSEVQLPAQLKKHCINIPFDRIHDALYFAHLFVGDTGTMSTEAALLGTPAIVCHPGIRHLGNFIELTEKYNLLYSFDDSRKAIEKAMDLIDQDNIKKEWRQKSEIVLKDKVDIVSFMCDFIENFPHSLYR